jgi:glycosyltransferase involved in cell wall biosynthesis
MNNPVVSVVMSVYNGELYLSEAIDSILAQTYTDFEFIIVEDGSTDGTWQMLRAYASQDSRIVLVQNPRNIGYTCSLNIGLLQAKGTYIARQDADDISMPERLAQQVAVLNGCPAVGLVGSHIDVIDSAGAPYAGLDFFSKETENAAIQRQLLFECRLCHGSLMIRRRCLDQVGAYDSELEPAEDYDLWLRLTEIAEVQLVAAPLYRYRYHTQSVSRTRLHQQLHHKALALDRALQRRYGAHPPLDVVAHNANDYLRAAFANYEYGSRLVAQTCLTRAQILQQSTLTPSGLLKGLLLDCTARYSLEDSLTLIQKIFSDLPPGWRLTQLKFWLKSRLYMREVFAEGDQVNVDSLLEYLGKGISYDFTWLFNRGVIVIVARLIGLKLRLLSHQSGSAPKGSSKIER